MSASTSPTSSSLATVWTTPRSTATCAMSAPWRLTFTPEGRNVDNWSGVWTRVGLYSRLYSQGTGHPVRCTVVMSVYRAHLRNTVDITERRGRTDRAERAGGTGRQAPQDIHGLQAHHSHPDRLGGAHLRHRTAGALCRQLRRLRAHRHVGCPKADHHECGRVGQVRRR